MKKAQGISIDVIIIAAIALLVLVIMAVLVINSGKQVDQNTKKCITLGGTCKDQYDECNNVLDQATDCEEGKQCCAVVG